MDILKRVELLELKLERLEQKALNTKKRAKRDIENSATYQDEKDLIEGVVINKEGAYPVSATNVSDKIKELTGIELSNIKCGVIMKKLYSDKMVKRGVYKFYKVSLVDGI